MSYDKPWNAVILKKVCMLNAQLTGVLTAEAPRIDLVQSYHESSRNKRWQKLLSRLCIATSKGDNIIENNSLR